MNLLFQLLCFLLLTYSHSVIADTKNIQIDIGGVKIDVQAPNGFHEISSLSPETHKFAETMVPPENRLLAVFVSEKDLGRVMTGKLPEFDRYMFLQTFRKTEDIHISNNLFQQLANSLNEQQNSLLKEVEDDVKLQLKNASKEISSVYDLSLNIKVGEQVPLGIFQEQANAISFAALAKYQTEAQGKSLEYVVAGGTSFVQIKNKLLYTYVFSSYKTQNDIDWVRTKSKKWISSLLSNNKLQTSESDPVSDIFVKLKLPKGVSVEIPKNWVVLTGNQRITLDSAVKSALDLTGVVQLDSKLPFAANYYDDNGRNLGILNIRYYPQNDITQTEARAATPQHVKEIDAVLKENITKSMKAFGMSISSWQGTHKTSINGITVFLTEYRRNSLKDDGEFRVRLIRVFSGNKSFTLTVSYNDTAAFLMKPIADRIISTLNMEDF